MLRAVSLKAFLVAINMVVVIGRNVLYLWVFLYREYNGTIVTQLALSLFKFAWNSDVIFRLVVAARGAVTSPAASFTISTSTLAVASDEDSSASPGGDDEEMAKRSSDNAVGKTARTTDNNASQTSLQSDRPADEFSTGEVRAIIAMQLFNNVITPAAAFAVVSANCFYNAFVPPARVVSSYTYNAFTYVHDDVLISIQSRRSISSVPPFQYTYQCRSSFLSAYAGERCFLLPAALLLRLLLL
jgi:hypothetical protein